MRNLLKYQNKQKKNIADVGSTPWVISTWIFHLVKSSTEFRRTFTFFIFDDTKSFFYQIYTM